VPEKVPLVAVVGVVAIGRTYCMVVVVMMMGMTICILMTLDPG